jgi:predicted RNA-binding Zn ribbon-like protein
VDLASYADLVIQLVNTESSEDLRKDRLANLDDLRELLTARPHLSGRVSRQDLDAMRGLRAELRTIFEEVDRGDEASAINRLNGLLIQHPIHPQVSGHDKQRWHLHLTESGSVPDRYAAGAVMGLAVLITDIGIERLGVCKAPPCRHVFFDTSTNRSRRYCSERCASRANVAAYRARRRENANGQAGDPQE